MVKFQFFDDKIKNKTNNAKITRSLVLWWYYFDEQSSWHLWWFSDRRASLNSRIEYQLLQIHCLPSYQDCICLVLHWLLWPPLNQAQHLTILRTRFFDKCQCLCDAHMQTIVNQPMLDALWPILLRWDCAIARRSYTMWSHMDWH